tara:strand:+ start:9531 stop:9767 length:237 start_codon:yes stop_codon:yes gene_type:complete
MNIKKLTEILGKELAAEVAAEDEAKRDGEFTIADMIETTGWSETTVRRKLALMLKEDRITKRGRRSVFYKASNTKASK